MHLLQSKPFTALILAVLVAGLITACSDQAGKNAAASMHKTIEQPKEKIQEATELHQKQLEADIEASGRGASTPKP
jgi:outer membrane biogenesis lipoprotein LolB